MTFWTEQDTSVEWYDDSEWWIGKDVKVIGKSIFKTLSQHFPEDSVGKSRKASGHFVLVYGQVIPTRGISPQCWLIFFSPAGIAAAAEVLNMWKFHAAYLRFYYLRFEDGVNFLLFYKGKVHGSAGQGSWVV
jgi:hypothetical protein